MVKNGYIHLDLLFIGACPNFIHTNQKERGGKRPFQKELTKVAACRGDYEMMGKVVTKPGTSISEVWNRSGLQ